MMPDQTFFNQVLHYLWEFFLELESLLLVELCFNELDYVLAIFESLNLIFHNVIDLFDDELFDFVLHSFRLILEEKVHRTEAHAIISCGFTFLEELAELGILHVWRKDLIYFQFSFLPDFFVSTVDFETYLENFVPKFKMVGSVATSLIQKVVLAQGKIIA